MATASSDCFICSNQGFTYYDFFLIENNSGANKKAGLAGGLAGLVLGGVIGGAVGAALLGGSEKYVVSAVVRLPLCKQCLSDRLRRYIKENTNDKGAPKMFAKKHVEAAQVLMGQLDSGQAPDPHLLQALFFITLEASDITIQLGEKNLAHPAFFRNTPVVLGALKGATTSIVNEADYSERYRTRKCSQDIDAKYVLWQLTDKEQPEPPFTADFKGHFEGGISGLFFAGAMGQFTKLEQPANPFMDVTTLSQVRAVYGYYDAHLRSF